MREKTGEAPIEFGPVFTKVNSERARRCSEVLAIGGFSIAKDEIEAYLAEPSPRIPRAPGMVLGFDASALASETIGQKIDSSSWLRAFHNGLADDDAIEESAERLGEEKYPDSLAANHISTYRGFCLLAHIRGGRAISTMVSGAENELVRQFVIEAGNLGLFLPDQWIASLNRKKITELLKDGHKLGVEKSQDTLAEELFETDNSLSPESVAHHAALTRDWLADSGAISLITYLTTNPDPNTLVTKLMNAKQLELLGQIAAEKPTS